MNINYNFSNLFSGMSNRTSGSSSLYSVLGEYNNIRSGTYYKLLKEYYKTDRTSSANKSNKTNNSVYDRLEQLNKNESSTASRLYTDVKGEASELKKAATALTATGDKSLFEEKEKKVKDEKTGEETTVKEVDRKAIDSAVLNYVSAYNDLLTSANNSKETGIIRNAGYMQNQTKIFKRGLQEVGITVNKDNTLSVDKDKLAAAKTENLKTLFNGSSSYAHFVTQRADMVSNAATTAATRADKLYNSSGQYYANDNFNIQSWYL